MRRERTPERSCHPAQCSGPEQGHGGCHAKHRVHPAMVGRTGQPVRADHPVFAACGSITAPLHLGDGWPRPRAPSCHGFCRLVAKGHSARGWDVALINVGSLIHAHFGGGIGSAGRPLVGSPDRDAGQEREFGLFVIDMESTEVTKMLDGAPFSKTPGQCCPPSARTAPSWRIGKSATRTIRFIAFMPKRTSAADSTHGTRSRPLSR